MTAAPRSLVLVSLLTLTLVPALASQQTVSYDDSTFGYLGPCPGGETHQYRFVVYSMAVRNVGGVTTNDTRAMVETAIIASSLDSTPLTGFSDAQ